MFSAPDEASSVLRLRSRMCYWAQRPTSIRAMKMVRLSKYWLSICVTRLDRQRNDA